MYAPYRLETYPIVERYPIVDYDNRDLIKFYRLYMAQVLNQDVDVCELVRLAALRQKNDLMRQDTDEFPYIFNEDEAVRFSLAMEKFKHYKGVFANKPFLLEPWQAFVNAIIFGWIHRETSLRRFTSSYLECPRKMGKTFWTSSIGLCFLALDGEPGAEVYTGATTLNQARIVFRDAKVLARKNLHFCKQFGIKILAKKLYIEDSESFLESLTKEGEANEGLNPHCAIIDEFHAHRNRDLYDVLRLGMGARAEPMLWMITTAGEDTASACYDVHVKTKNVLEGLIEDDSHFGIIYTIDKGDEDNWRDEKIWRKANPNYGVSVFERDFIKLTTEAESSPASLGSFLTKRLNIWTSAGNRWLNMVRWADCADRNIKIEQYIGFPCYVAFDLASHVDMTSVCFLFDILKSDMVHEYVAFFRHFIPEKQIDKGANPHYSGWKEKSWLTTTPGEVIDFAAVKRVIKEVGADQCKAVEFAYDPYKSQQLAQELEKDGCHMVVVRQGYNIYSPIMKYTEGQIISGRLLHEDNPVTNWMAANVMIKPNEQDKIMPLRNTKSQKIDGMHALLMAMSRATAIDTDIPMESHYNKEMEEAQEKGQEPDIGFTIIGADDDATERETGV